MTQAVSRGSRSAAGFTLVELLVALVLLALVSTMLVGTLRFANGAWAKSEAATDRLQRTEMAMSLLRRQLEAAYPLIVIGSDQQQIVAFAGDEAGLLFLSPPAAALAMGGLQLSWLTVEPDGGAHRIVLRWRNYDRRGEAWPPELNGGRGMAELVLGETPGSAVLSYFGPDATPNSSLAWRRGWANLPALPNLIRLSFAGSGTNIPDLVVAPHRGGSGGLVSPLAQATN
jgi:general secretion pathway protein J